MSDPYETLLEPVDELRFRQWKERHAPKDSGADYDLRGAFQSGVTPAANGHWPDTYKKPNHPTFSVESQYARLAPERAGRWSGEMYIPPRQEMFPMNPSQINPQMLAMLLQNPELMKQIQGGMPPGGPQQPMGAPMGAPPMQPPQGMPMPGMPPQGMGY